MLTRAKFDQATAELKLPAAAFNLATGILDLTLGFRLPQLNMDLIFIVSFFKAL